MQESIICESEQYEKGSPDRAKCLERLHEKLRQLAKRPKIDCLRGGQAPRNSYSSAQDEWVDFLAPSCSLCGQAEDGSCKCEELAANAESFLADGESGNREAGSVGSVFGEESNEMDSDMKST